MSLSQSVQCCLEFVHRRPWPASSLTRRKSRQTGAAPRLPARGLRQVDAAFAARARVARRHRRRARGPGQADPGRAHAGVFRHWRVEPWRPDAGPARRLGHSRRRQARQRDAAAHALLRQSRCPHPRAQPRRPRSQDLALHRDLQIRRYAGNPGAGHLGHRRRAQGRPCPAHPRAVPRRYRAQDARHQQRTARAVRGLRHSHARPRSQDWRALLRPHQCRAVAGSGAWARRGGAARGGCSR